MNIAELELKTRDELQEMAKELGIAGVSTLRKQDLIFRLLQAQTEQQGNIFKGGVLEIVEDGFGFLRQERYLPGPNDVYVSQSQIRRFGLRTGDMVTGQVRPPKDNEIYYGLLRVEAVNGLDPLRFPHCHLPARADQPGDLSQQPHPTVDQSCGSDRTGAARSNRVSTQGRQDNYFEAYRKRDYSQ